MDVPLVSLELRQRSVASQGYSDLATSLATNQWRTFSKRPEDDRRHWQGKSVLQEFWCWTAHRNSSCIPGERASSKLRSSSVARRSVNHNQHPSSPRRDQISAGTMKNALLAGVTVLLLASSAHAAEKCVNPDGTQDPVCANDEDWGGEPRQRVTVAPPLPPGPPPLGWVYGPYTMCGDPPRCSTGVVNVQADGLNVRVTPNGPPVMSLVNGTPIIPLNKQGDWLLIAPEVRISDCLPE